jgi:hypothetical protein
VIEEVFTIHGIPQVVHADRGTSMTSKSVARLLNDLHVTRSHSRPRVSNDNPFSEPGSRPSNTRPRSPNASEACNTRGLHGRLHPVLHRHTGIGLHTAADVHYGLTDAIDELRQAVLSGSRSEPGPVRCRRQRPEDLPDCCDPQLEIRPRSWRVPRFARMSW